MLLIPNNIHQKFLQKMTVYMRIAKYLLFSSIHHVSMPKNLQSSSKKRWFYFKKFFSSI